MSYKFRFLKEKRVEDKRFYIKEFEDGNKLVMTGVDFNFRKYNLHNTDKFLKHYQLSKKPVAKTRQKHTRNVYVLPKPGEYVGYDGFIRENKSFNPIMIVTADCIPILIRGKNYSALVHAGWRGVKQEIYFSAINKLVKLGEKKSDFEVYILPSISKDSFQVGGDFVKAFKNRYGFNRYLRKDTGDKYKFDLASFVAFELGNYGIKGYKIYREEYDTKRGNLFHSYRREGKNYGLNAILYC